jgi:hypothetical protein
MLQRDHVVLLIFHLALLTAIIFTRYTGLFYPLFSSAILVFVYKGKIKILYALTPLLLLWFIYINVSSTMYRIGKTRTFSAFSGWQTANNALHIIPYIDLKTATIRDPELRKIHLAALETTDSAYKALGITVAFMWDAQLPLKKYFIRYMDEYETGYMISWSKTSTYFNNYGHLLMIKYPLTYLRYFLIPNARIAIYPYNTEMLEESKTLSSQYLWFNKDSESYPSPRHDPFKKFYFPALPLLTCLLWIFLGVSLICLKIIFRKAMLNSLQKQVVIFSIMFLLAFTLFHIYAAPVAIRYLLGIHALQLVLIYISIFSIMKLSGNKNSA